MEGLKSLKAKSCDDADFSFLQHPNLQREASQAQVVNLLKDTSALLSVVSNMDRADCRGEIPRIDTCDIIAQGCNLTSCLPNATLNDTYISYAMEKYRAAFNVEKDFMDCNKLGEETQVNELMQAMILTQIRNNMELAAIYGDKDLPTGDGQSDWNNLMGKNDGWLKQAFNCAPANQIIDAAGAGLSEALFMAARKAIPAKYRPNRSNFKYIYGPSVNDWWLQNRTARPTAAGDVAMATGQNTPIFGGTGFEVPMWRENLAYGSGGSAQEVTHILYTPMDNLLFLNRRKFELHTEYKPETDKFQSVAYWTQDAIIQRPEEVVVLANVDVCGGTPYSGCVTVPVGCDLGATFATGL
tara:strand:- start:1991 stop:3055 length:1065 start_codon:yes stop_codon:yes gene_type:complete